VIGSSDTSIKSPPIITGRKRGGRNKKGAVVIDEPIVSQVAKLWKTKQETYNWIIEARKREPFAWKAYSRAAKRACCQPYFIYWLFFLDGWKARVRNEPIKGIIRQIRFWGRV